MARRRRHSQKTSLLSGTGSPVHMIEKFALGAAPTLTFLSAISSKDQAALDAQTTFVGRAKTMINIATGHTTGFNLFGDVPKFKATTNPGGVLGPLTMASAGGIVAGIIMKSVGKKTGLGKLSSAGSKIARVSAASLPAALVGYYFDPPVDSPQQVTPSYSTPAVQYTQQIQTQSNYNTSAPSIMTPFQ